MRLGIRHKITAVNLIVLLGAFLVVSLIVISGLDRLNRNMTVQSLIHQAEVSTIFVKQSLLSGEHPSPGESEFAIRSRDLVYKLSREAGVRVLAFTPAGMLLADSDDILRQGASFPELTEVAKGNRTHTIRSYGGSRYMYFAFPVNISGRMVGQLMLIHPLAEADRTVMNVAYLLLISFAAGTVIITIVSVLLSYRLAKPVTQLKETASKIAGGDYGLKIEARGTDEIADLAAAFNSMSEEVASHIKQINIERRKLDLVLQSMGEGVVALDGSGRVITRNSRAKSVMDQNFAEEIGGIASRVIQSGTMAVVEKAFEDRSLLICATPMALDSNETGAVLIINDVTQLRLLQEKQRQFISNVSHELKTPLTTILGYIDLLKAKSGDPAVLAASLKHLEDAGGRLMRLFDDLMDLARLSRFEFEIEPVSTDLSVLVNDIAAQMSLKAQKFGISINSDARGPLIAIIDPLRIKQALVNIIDNAIKYSSGGAVKLLLENEDGAAILSVSDNGCGIPADMLDKVFEPFYRVDKARTRLMGGSGLGLSITRQIIEKHGGSIWIDSTEGQGTTVTMKIPTQKL